MVFLGSAFLHIRQCLLVSVSVIKETTVSTTFRFEVPETVSKAVKK